MSATKYPCLLICAVLVCALTAPVRAADAAADMPAAAQNFALHGQFTYVEQDTSDFNAPYRGANSLSPSKGAETTDATLYLGARPWRGAEIWLNGEIDQGFGLDDTLGVAGFPSAEAYKVGKNQPYLRLTRLYLRQTVGLDGESQSVAPAANQLGGTRSDNRIVITVGKFSVPDVFDGNPYAHDQRVDFLNWTAIDTGTFDYASDAWGYTVGASAEWYENSWTLRGGLFDLSNIPNSPHLDPGFHEFQGMLELEHRHAIGAHRGSVLVTAYDSRGRMGVLDQAVDLAQTASTPVDIAAVRSYRSRTGLSLSAAQELNDDLGLFARAGRAGGAVEAYEFTDVDRSLVLGASLQGTCWHRAADTIALAAIDNKISASRQRYLDAGGLGILVGDGSLPHPGPEQILETYYSAALFSSAHVSFDYQYINHPAYNRDRGPVSVFAIRVHAQF